MKKLLTTLFLALIAGIAISQVSITVNVPIPIGFSAALTATGVDSSKVTNLTVTGNINQIDIDYMRNFMHLLAVLDLESAHIKTYDEYLANQMPSLF